MVAGCAKKCKFLVDVGTDHAYIPIYLVEKNIAQKAVACDISKGSVEKAKKNIEKYSYSDIIEARVGDGLKVIDCGENPDQIIIAGMGGLLTIDILNNSKDVVNLAERIILQPQRDIDKVRKTVHSLGFKIIDEKMTFEDGKYYNVIVCEKGKDCYYSEKDYFFGKILLERKDEFLKKQIAHELFKVERILNKMSYEMSIEEKNDVFLNRFHELEIKRDLYKFSGV